MSLFREIEKALMPLKRKIIMSISRLVINTVKDSEELQTLQGSIYADETRELLQVMQHYGFASHTPRDGEGIVVFPGGNREEGVVIATEHREFRFKNLGEGEVCVYDKNGNLIHIKSGGEIEIRASSKVVVNSPQVELGAAATQSVIRGEAFKAYFDTHTHVSGSPGAPTSPPQVPMPSITLSEVSKTT